MTAPNQTGSARRAPPENPGQSVCFRAERTYVDGEFQTGLDLVVEGDTIVEVSSRSISDGQRVVHLADAAIFPGAVNTHTHSFQSLLRGQFSGLSLEVWLRGIYGAARDFRPEDCYLGALITFSEMLLSGTTTVVDFFYLNARGNDNIKAVIKASRDVGIRLIAARTFLDADWGGLAAREASPAQIEERFRELILFAAGDARVTPCPAPHSLYGTSRTLIELAYSLAKENDTSWYMHLADSRVSAEDIAARSGMRSVELLDAWNVLDERFVGVHALWLSDREIALLANHAAAVSHNPASNMLLGETILDLPRIMGAGIRVGIGTDGAASNVGHDIFHDARLALMAQCVRAADPTAMTTDRMLRALTADGGSIVRLPVGQLQPGCKADFLVLDLQSSTLLPTSALANNVLLSLTPNAIRAVYCGGEEVVRDGALTRVDRDELARHLARLRVQ